MSAIGTKQTSRLRLSMSAVGGKADIQRLRYRDKNIGDQHGIGQSKKNPAPGHGAGRLTNIGSNSINNNTPVGHCQQAPSAFDQSGHYPVKLSWPCSAVDVRFLVQNDIQQ
jgi:hypothetical protein